MNRLFIFFFAFLSLQTTAQYKKISGRIADATTGNHLPYVSVQIKGSKTGTYSDADGKFKLQCGYKPVILVFSSVGYTVTEKAVSATDSVVSVLLEPVQTKYLSEVVVVSTSLGMKTNGPRIKGKVLQKAPNTESYKEISENPFHIAGCEPVSTFAADIDRASYSNIRRFLNTRTLPPADAVKIEEMINYFDYDYPAPHGKEPYSIYTELTECPWNNQHQLMRVALKCKTENGNSATGANLVFLIDVSGSMQTEDRLPMVIESFKLLLDSLAPTDRVAIVTYAGKPGLALESTPVSEKKTILKTLENLSAGGSTAGSRGIELAYETARNHFIEGGNNRVILATDGDFNVGVTSYSALESMIEQEKRDDVFLTCLGFGTGNYKDDVMEALADKGNGNYYYIDQLDEAKRVLQKEFRGTLNVIAKDVKLQAEFNPKFVQSYRLIGYENRLLDEKDFDNDTKDAGELGEGHTLTALYEIVPVRANDKTVNCAGLPVVEPQKPFGFSPESNELAVIRTRYKLPDGFKSRRKDFFVINNPVPFSAATPSTRFAASVAMFGMMMRHSAFAGNATTQQIAQIAGNALKDEYAREFLHLVAGYELIAGSSQTK